MPALTTFLAEDGTAFDKETCRRRRGYKIGPKGAEEWVKDFDEALARLKRMPWPYWRRPSATSSIFGIVKGRLS